MGAAYAQDLRDRVLAAYDRGMQTLEIATLFQISKAWARRVKQRRRDHGETMPRAMGGARVVKIDAERLRQLVAEQPDATTRELHQRLGCACCESAVGMALDRLGLTFKKKKTIAASEQDRPDVAQRREQWKENQPKQQAQRLIFIDETWAKTNMTRLRGRAPAGEQLLAKTPFGRRRR